MGANNYRKEIYMYDIEELEILQDNMNKIRNDVDVKTKISKIINALPETKINYVLFCRDVGDILFTALMKEYECPIYFKNLWENPNATVMKLSPYDNFKLNDDELIYGAPTHTFLDYIRDIFYKCFNLEKLEKALMVYLDDFEFFAERIMTNIYVTIATLPELVYKLEPTYFVSGQYFCSKHDDIDMQYYLYDAKGFCIYNYAEEGIGKKCDIFIDDEISDFLEECLKRNPELKIFDEEWLVDSFEKFKAEFGFETLPYEMSEEKIKNIIDDKQIERY